MYITTFYSFKGGVGRTLALVNIAVELAQTGRRVLIVDFDLEAPGVDTFDLPRPQEPIPGLVEYVSVYLQTHKSPNAATYIYQAAGIGQQGGELWIMPSGKGDDDSYSSKLAAIDWLRLYTEHAGYLMFEDLKAQWQELLAPDYVLIDSRTGHTDIGGICTRHLPDAVVLMFFPNEQNLRGLKKVVKDIREEAEGARRKRIQLHFVMSNVPDLDDEDEILKGSMLAFRNALGYKELTATIHRYDSLALLNQTIFTLARPKSRLAQEYRNLLTKIVKHNIQDREGALNFLKDLTRPALRSRYRFSPDEIAARLEEIRNSHPQDGDILFRLSMYRRKEGRIEDALTILDEAVKAGAGKPEALIERAELRRLSDNPRGASEDVMRVLSMTNALDFDIYRGVRLLRQVDEKALLAVAETPAVQALDISHKIALVHDLQWSHSGLVAAREILVRLFRNGQLSDDQKDTIKRELSLCLIGMGRFSEALEIFSKERSKPQEITNIHMAFNCAMAEWGHNKQPPRNLFEHVVELDKESRGPAGANYHQCLALALWVTGDTDGAKQRLYRSRQSVMERPVSVFSCWRYLMVTTEIFLEDLGEISQLINGVDVSPRFISVLSTEST